MRYNKLYMIFNLFYFLHFVSNENIKNESESQRIEHNSNDENFLEDDKEWHISHLRNMDIPSDGCEITFEEKVIKYRKALKNDGALVDFVSADALPVKKGEIVQEKCQRNASPIFFGNNNEGGSNNEEVKQVTVDSKLNIKEPDVVNMTKQRRSEYQFSSVEYYDEVQDFDPSICPDTAEVIELQIDQLRNYDVECEAMIEWRSLE